MCVVCRKKAGKQNLKRFVLDTNQSLIADDLYQATGRGAYVHWQCMQTGYKTKDKLMYNLKKVSIKK